jgi:hypothetical protein
MSGEAQSLDSEVVFQLICERIELLLAAQRAM